MREITLKIIHAKHIKVLAHAPILARRTITVRLLRSGPQMMRYIERGILRKTRAALVVV
jgi:hypothetical protein